MFAPLGSFVPAINLGARWLRGSRRLAENRGIANGEHQFAVSSEAYCGWTNTIRAFRANRTLVFTTVTVHHHEEHRPASVRSYFHRTSLRFGKGVAWAVADTVAGRDHATDTT